MKLLIFVFSCAIINNSFAKADLPLYIPKCSLSDKNYSECATRNANIALPNIIKGDESVGFPNLSPLRIAKRTFRGKNVVLHGTNIVIDSFRTAKIESTSVDFKKMTGYVNATMDDLSGTGTYLIENGRLLDRTFSGQGPYIVIFSGNKITWKADIELYKKDRKTHMRFVNKKYELILGSGYYHFQNLKSPEKGEDINTFINKHWAIFANDIKHDIDDMVFYYINLIIDNICENVALSDMFYP